MLLKEIIDEPYKSNDLVPNKTATTVDKLPQHRLQFKGQGYFSDVYDIDNNPHEIVKHSSHLTGAKEPSSEKHDREDYDEGFRYYAEAILADSSAISNPYLPRIRAYAADKREQQYVIETLIDSSSIFDYIIDGDMSDPEFRHQRNMINTLGQRIFTNWEEIIADCDDDTQSPEILEKIISLIDYGCNGGNIQTNDKKLIQAITLIRNTAESNRRLRIDVHYENVMFRRSKLGLQLVITDPLALLF